MICSTTTEEIRLDELVDYRHPPITQRYALKSGVAIKFGQAVKIGTDGTVEAAATGDTFYGVACENATQSGDVTHITILIHGTVKASKVLVGEAAPVEADLQGLKGAGIYVLN